MATQRVPVDVNRAVDEILLLAEKQLTKAGVRIVARLDRGLPPTLGDPSQLQQVVLNLLSNAQQAIAGAGEIRIVTRAASAPAGWIELIVSDTGPGIPPDVLSRIFDPFFTTKSEGTGLGLSITQRIAHEHGWEIQVRSTPGAGTDFMVRFPPVSE
jgi:two-component system NtrC family sensor kinase